MRIAGLTLLSTDVHDEASVIGDALAELIERQVFQRITAAVRFPYWMPTPLNRRFHAARRQLDEIVLRIIGERRAHPGGADFLSLLMDARDEETGEGMTDAQLRDEVMTLFLAGHETTAAALSFAIWALTQHPDVAARVIAEVDAVCGSGDVDVAHVMRMPYLDAFFSEVMRLWPPIPLLARQCEAGDVVESGGRRYTIEPGALCFVAPLVVHRHPAYWHEPERFDPARFLPGGEGVADDRPKFAYFPFSGGPRKCIGDQFARLEQKVVLARLLQRVSFVAAPDARVEPFLSVSLRTRSGVRARLAARTARPATPVAA